MLKKYVFAVVGALGNVGTELRSILETSNLPIKKLVLMDVPQNAGKKVHWRDEDFTVVESKPESFSGVDIAIIGFYQIKILCTYCLIRLSIPLTVLLGKR